MKKTKKGQGLNLKRVKRKEGIRGKKGNRSVGGAYEIETLKLAAIEPDGKQNYRVREGTWQRKGVLRCVTGRTRGRI
jgi:hypothetical protein